MLRDETARAQEFKEGEKGFVRGLVVEEAEFAAFGHVSDDFDGAAEIGVGVPGGGEAVEVGFDEVVPLGEDAPLLVGFGGGELGFEWGGFGWKRGGGEVEPIGEARPHPGPAEDVSVDHVEGLVAGGGGGGGPEEMTREEAGVGHVGERVPLGGGAGEDEGCAGFAAERGVDGEGDAHVHGVAVGVADDGVGAVDGPGEALLGGRGEELVFLRVVEVFERQAGLLFAEGCGGEGSFAVGLEGAEIVLEAGDEGDVFDRLRGAESCEQVAHHGGVDADVFGFGGLAEPGGEEDVGGLSVCESLVEAGGVEEVDGDGLDAWDCCRRIAGEAEDLPALGDEVCGQVVADDSSDAGDECGGHGEGSCGVDAGGLRQGSAMISSMTDRKA